MGTKDQKTFHGAFPNSASTAEEIDDEKEGKTKVYSFAQSVGIAITIPKRATDRDAVSFAERDGFSDNQRSRNSRSDRRDISGPKRDCNS